MVNKLVNKGNTVIIIEHNMDVIKTVDHIIEIGPNGGKLGGKIIFSGSPEELCKLNDSPTAYFLKKDSLYAPPLFFLATFLILELYGEEHVQIHQT